MLTSDLKALWQLDETSGTRFDAWGNKFERDARNTLPNNLVAYWTLDELSGTREDEKGTNHLTDNNTVTQALGKKVRGAQFTRANSEYLSVADNSDISMGDIDFTIAFWFYMDSVPPSSGDTAFNFVAKGSSNVAAQNEYLVRVNNATGLGGTRPIVEFVVANGINSTTLSSTVILSINTWYFVVVWHDSVNDTMNVQINGGAIDSTSRSGGSFDSTHEFTMGNEPTTHGGFHDGRIDEVGIWKRVLTAEERSLLYNSGRGNSYTRSLSLTDNNTVGVNTGIRSRAGQFVRANSEYLNRANNSAIKTGDIGFTVSAWVYLDSKPGNMAIYTKSNDSTDQREFGIDYRNSEDRFRFFVDNDGSPGGIVSLLANSFGSPSTASWHLIVAWHDPEANTINIQINNGTIDSSSHTLGVFVGTSSLGIGAINLDTTPSNFWNGRIDEAVFWKRVLTSQERSDLYNAGRGNTVRAILKSKSPAFGKELVEV